MPDYTALELQEEAVPAPLTTSFVDDVRRLIGGCLYTLAVTAIGSVLVIAGLLLCVLGAPLIAAAVGYAVVRRRKLDQAPAALEAAV
jgi:hypothetical protein